MATFLSLGANAKPRNPIYKVGKKLRIIPSRFALLTAALTNGDVLILAGPLTFDMRVHMVFAKNSSPALTSATDAKLGFFYKAADGTYKLIKTGSDAVLWNGVTLAGALSTRDLLMDRNTALDTTKNIGELLSLTSESEPTGGVFLGLTFVTKPSVDANIDWDIYVEEANTK